MGLSIVLRQPIESRPRAWHATLRAPARIEQPLHNLDDAAAHALLAVAPGADVSPWVGALQNYCEDLAYADWHQPALFAWLLPMCLEAWRLTLATPPDERSLAMSTFTSAFHFALTRSPRLVETVLDREAQRRVEQISRTMLWSAAGRSSSASQIDLTWLPHLVTVGGFWSDQIGPFWDGWMASGSEDWHAAWSVLGLYSKLGWSDEENPLGGPHFARLRLWDRTVLFDDGVHWSPAAAAALAERLAQAPSTLMTPQKALSAAPDADFAMLVLHDLATSQAEQAKHRAAEWPRLLMSSRPDPDWSGM